VLYGAVAHGDANAAAAISVPKMTVLKIRILNFLLVYKLLAETNVLYVLGPVKENRTLVLELTVHITVLFPLFSAVNYTYETCPGVPGPVAMAVLASPLLQRFSWIEHGFGTRDGPISQEGMASLAQIHSSLVLTASESNGCVGEGDALITNRANVFVSVRTADCFPILLADDRGKVVAAVHAGWRGTAAGVSKQTLKKMAADFGTEPRDIYAAIGPGIGPCCYAVGAEVARLFTPPGVLVPVGHIDLAEVNRRQLVEAGVPESQIEIVGGCTHCDPLRFYSYRRDRFEARRMISYIRPVP
jgi:YfiH family protein